MLPSVALREFCSSGGAALRPAPPACLHESTEACGVPSFSIHPRFRSAVKFAGALRSSRQPTSPRYLLPQLRDKLGARRSASFPVSARSLCFSAAKQNVLPAPRVLLRLTSSTYAASWGTKRGPRREG